MAARREGSFVCFMAPVCGETRGGSVSGIGRG